MNIPPDLLAKLVGDFHKTLSPTQYGIWADGFWHVVCHGESSHDDDNPYLPSLEQIPYTQYKLGAKAAESLLKCLSEDQLN